MSITKTSQIDDGSQKEEIYKVSPYRFVIFLVYCLVLNQIVLVWSVWTPIQTDLQNMYGESITFINFATILIAGVSYIPASLFANYIVDVYGLRVGTIVGCLLIFIGLWVRCLSDFGFIYIFIGQIFGGISQPFLFGSPQKISNVWFAPSERAYATTIMASSTIIGNSIGPLVPNWFMDTDSTDYVSMKPGLQKMMFWLAIVHSVVFAITIIFMKDKPDTPPSRAAAAEKYNFVDSAKQIVRNKSAMMMLMATAIINGGLVNYLSTMQQVTSSYNFSPSTIGDILSIAFFVGLIGPFAGAVLVHMFKAYNMVLIVSGVGSFLTMILNYFAAESGSTIFFAISTVASFLLPGPMMPIGLEYGIELAFPVGEATIGAVWFLTNQSVSTVQSLVIDAILGDNPTMFDAKVCFIIMMACQGLAVIPLFFVKQDLRRTEYEKKDPMALDEVKVSSVETALSDEYTRKNL